MKSTPGLELLRQVVDTLERSDVSCALGGSGLLKVLDLGVEVRDWDLTTEAPLERVVASLAPFVPRLVGPNGIHADHKLVVGDEEIEVIVGWSIRWEDEVIRLPTVVTGRWQGIPLGSLESWAVGYALLGRPEKSETLFRHLARHGASEPARGRLLGGHLPPELRAKLESLPSRIT